MIIEHVGNLLDVENGIIVHGCNCQGMMGSGIAKAIRDKWPGVYMDYLSIEDDQGYILGDIQVVAGANFESKSTSIMGYYEDIYLPANIIVVNAMTQDNYGSDKSVVYVDYDAISAAFARIKILARETKLPVHFPLIGCGLANGEWKEVAPRIEAALGPNIEKHLWKLPQ
jgi:O-acetyl-ADP-ribose deacetylase (regulator of RNase III)